MRVRSLRLLSLVLVFVLMLGMMPAVYASAASGTESTNTASAEMTQPPSDESEETPETVPVVETETVVAEDEDTDVNADEATETTDSSDVSVPEESNSPAEPEMAESSTDETGEPSDNAGEEITYEDELRWADLSCELPIPYEEYFPYDPTIQYPYGLPMENFYPSSLLEADPYGIMLLADMNRIPDEMYDNAILRALEYTGFDVQWLKNNGYLYVAQYVSSNILSYAPSVLSNIGYDDYSPFLNGDETVADSSTVTGRAPDIARFEQNGLVCASFVSYFINNYLPNIEGIDTSHIANAIKATTMSGSSYSTASVWSWNTGLNNLASQSGSGVTKYTNAATAYANLVPGDVIIFSNSSGLAHAAIYAGTYDFYNASGTNRGEYHFIIHVGNSRGPEISTVEYMGSAGSKSSTPSAWFHLDVNDMVNSAGYIEVYKTDTEGRNLSGAQFKAVNQDTGISYPIGPTNSNGYAISTELPYGTYRVTESIYPTGYQSNGVSAWTVTLGSNTPNGIITINAVNRKITGGFTIQKATNTGSGLSGWQIGVFTDAACTKHISGSPFTTGTNGKIAVTGLTPATYYVKELSGSTDLWTTDNTVKTVVVTNGSNPIVTITNTQYGYGKIIKQTNTDSSLSGWKFNIFTDIACTKPVDGAPFVTDSTGTITRKLLPGTYYVQEVDESAANPTWDYDTNIRELKVEAGNTKSVTFINTQYGYAQIIKQTNTGNNLSGWKFNLYTDANCTQLVSGSPFISSEDGTITARLLPGTYYVREVDESAVNPMWVYDTDTKDVMVTAGATGSVTFTNQHLGNLLLIKSMPDGGSTAGYVFDIYRASDNAYIGTYTTGEDGTIQSDNLLPGDYLVYEQIDESSIYWCETENPQTVSVVAGETNEVTFVNRLNPGKIAVQKVDITGEPLAGAVFLLEWSADGTSWSPVSYTDSPYVVEGACSSPDLKDGILTSPESGLVEFTGLHPELLYRLTEIKAPDGYQLLVEPAYEGSLITEAALTAEFTVVNVRTFYLPETGSNSMLLLPMLFIAAPGLYGFFALIPKRKRQ